MGNTTNPKRWEAQRRLEFVEQAAFWRGWVLRSDLVETFSLSLPQASADIQAYLEINPNSLQYDLKAKRYFAADEMSLKLSSPDLGGAISRFLQPVSGKPRPGDRFASIDLPFRATPVSVTKSLFRAVCQRLAIEINYLSVNSGTEAWRWIAPHAFAHDGYRWHVRAFCYQDGTYKDFVVGRIAKTKVPVERESPPVPDADWNTWETIRLRPHSNLTRIQRRAVEMDYDMRRGVVTLEVRRSMKNYTLAYLSLGENEDFPRLLELVRG